MSYSILRVQKYTVGGVKGIEIHDRREKQGTSNSNPDIDWSRTHLNYTLVDTPEQSFHMLAKKRREELPHKKAYRKDAVVLAGVIVTSDKAFFDALPDNSRQEYFERSLAFIKARYGAGNIISAIVHLDEKTPHMHVNFVPVYQGRLCAKQLFTRKSLTELQTAFHEQVGEGFGLERGEVGSKTKHLDVARYKEQKALEHERESNLATQNARNEEKAYRDSINALKGQEEALEREIKALEETTAKQKAHIAKGDDRIKELVDAVKEKKGQIAELEKTIEQLEKDKENSKAAIANGIDKIQKLNADIKQAEARLGELTDIEQERLDAVAGEDYSYDPEDGYEIDDDDLSF